MKIRIMFIFCMLALIVSNLNAQGIHDKGVKLGINLAYAKGDDTEQYQNENKNFRLGFIGGLFFAYQMNQIVSIQPEFYYSMQGVKFSIGESKKEYKTIYQQDYIKIPVLLKFNLSPSSRLFQPNFLIGPSIGFLVNSQFKDGSNNIDIMDETNALDIGIVFCGEFIYNKFIIDLRYNLGLTNVLSNSMDWKNSVCSIMFGIII